MSGDTGPLQRLTDEQVNARLAAYNPDGSLQRDVHRLWDDAGDIIESEVSAQFGPDAAAKVQLHYSGKVDSAWVQDVAEYGRRIYRERTSVPAYIAARDQLITRIIGRMFERYCDQADTLKQCVTAFQRLTSFETDIILAQVALLEAIDAADSRGRESEQFERRVSDLVRASTEQSTSLTDRTRATAASARGMLGKTSEVAAAAEQSAVAMREAAQTAAGLIRAIEDARSEVEVAAGVATRAGEQASEAVKVSQALSAHVEAIESILSLIRDIAGQTNLLALNATIEAARAGEAGKGFAVVANEVKELAKETAKATEDISQKIEAIQGDTRGAVEAIEEISSIIGQINDIQSSIASAVEEQTATTNEIARNVSEAARGSGEIAENITGVATAAQGTAKGAEETQRAAGELAQMATELQALVDRFRV
jgi:methyl-accepting chemotaxis protein